MVRVDISSKGYRPFTFHNNSKEYSNKHSIVCELDLITQLVTHKNQIKIKKQLHFYVTASKG